MKRRNRCIIMFIQMRLVWLWVMLLVLASECYGCLEHERAALLQLKASSINHQNRYFLPTWVEAWEGEMTTDCCKWERVKCNATTGRVIQLSLNSPADYYLKLRDWYLNASMFLPFEELESLDLSNNQLAGWLENEGFEKLGELTSLKSLNLSLNSLKGTIHINDLGFNNLEQLDISWNWFDAFIAHSGFKRPFVLGKLELLRLDWNSFNNSILPSLGLLSSLKTLSLSKNGLVGSIDIGEFCKMNNLKELDLSGNFIEDIKGFEQLSVLGKLELLRLDSNSFNNSILPSLGVLSSLKTLSLSLSLNGLNGSIDLGVFRNMNNIEELDLRENSIEDIKGFERLSVLGKLKLLDLSYNSFNNGIIPSLGFLSSLKTLCLGHNNLNGSIDIGEFHNMSNLEELDLSYNDIDNIKGLKSLSKLKMLNLRWNELKGLVTSNGLDGLKHLQELYLDYSSIDKIFLHNVGVMSSLRVLTLRNISLNGSLPNQGWCELPNLQELDLSENGINGMLPSCLEDLTSIRILDLSFNQLTGNLTSSPLSNLTTLEYLILSNNHFEIPVSFISFCNHSKLKVFLGDNNRLNDQTESQTWAPKFQLQVFSLSNCGSYNPGMKLPQFLFYQYDLRIVDISNSTLVGMFPVWLLKNNTRLEVLSLRKGHLTGPFLLPSYPSPFVFSIDISDNLLEDQIPRHIGLIFPNLRNLNMSSNLFEGYIPTLGDMHSLFALDLSSNNLSGQIPEHLVVSCLSLGFLKLSNNNLHGLIPLSFVNLTSLRYLYLDNNHFVGKFPNSICFPPYLMAIGISNNHLSGELPRWMGDISDLIGINMFSNNLEGPIPIELCKLGQLEFLDLSDNNLSGSIPSCFNGSQLRHVHLNQNKLKGSMTFAFCNCSFLVTLDISDNNLSGIIPSWIATLSQLSILLLKLNNFECEIPIQLCQLKQLSILDLSQNNFYGSIPHCFVDIPFGTTHTKSSVEVASWYGNILYSFWEFVKGSKSLGEYDRLNDGSIRFRFLDIQQEVEFTTKHGIYAYKGNILDYMSGVDLSCNHLTGEIPIEIGKLSNIHALNLSHNNLTGSIPTTFSHLRQIESLDLSYNNLNGRIPQLIELGNLEVFSVAHNNLSGQTPERKAQFATFEESSYEGNSFLCGFPLKTNCLGTVPTSTMPKVLDGEAEYDGFIDMGVFYVSFLVSYIIVLMGIVAVLFINPHWRRVWFQLIEVCMTTWYYFVLENFMKFLSNRSV